MYMETAISGGSKGEVSKGGLLIRHLSSVMHMEGLNGLLLPVASPWKNINCKTSLY